MPQKNKKPCSKFGCKNLTNEKYCTEHKKEFNRERDKKRLPSSQRGYDANWRRLRNWFISHNPVCNHCGSAGEVVDHIIPHKMDMILFNDVENLQTLCKRCHDVKTATEGGEVYTAKPVLMPNWLKPSIIPLIIVCGPAGAGKSTWINKRANEKDLIVDLDLIKAKITKTKIYEKYDIRSMNAAIIKRNQILEDIGTRRTHENVYYIVSGGKQDDRNWWNDKLKPKEIVVIDTPIDICIDRIRNDSRRSVIVQELHIKSAIKWWKDYTGEDVHIEGKNPSLHL